MMTEEDAVSPIWMTEDEESFYYVHVLYHTVVQICAPTIVRVLPRVKWHSLYHTDIVG